MANPFPPGRMLRKDISRSHKIAKLSPKALSLFCLIIPHLNSYGKLNGDPLYIKAECAPLIPWLTPSVIKKCLREINEHTNVKWFEHKGCWYLHALHWQEHQDLREKRFGQDHLPSFPNQVPEQSGSSPGVVPHEVEVEGEGEVESEVENKKKEKEEKEKVDGFDIFAIASYKPQKQFQDSVSKTSSKNHEHNPRLSREEKLNEIRELHRQGKISTGQVSSLLREAGFPHEEINRLAPQFLQDSGGNG